MQLSTAGFNLIREFEGFIPYLYDDAANNATVGIGILVHLGPTHTPRGLCALCDEWPRLSEQGQWITEARGLELLIEKVQPYAACVENYSRPLTQNEYDALTSLAYNIGVGGYANSSVRVAVNSGGDVCAALMQYVHGTDGVTYPGLVRRRQAECTLFNTEEETRLYTDAQIDEKVGALFANAMQNGADILAHGAAINFLCNAVVALANRGAITPEVQAELEAQIADIKARQTALEARVKAAADALGGGH
jgi:GH24 family phage-related lysozyme (muramidase)